MNKKKEDTDPKVFQFAAAWGWNANSRAGNNTETELRIPQQVQKSKTVNYVSCAAGKHHSLLVTNEGNVYAFGENRKDQLGFGNGFSKQPLKGVESRLQAFPRGVTPSGSYIFKHDLKMIEVTCGAGVSYAREQTPKEGINSVLGYKDLLSSVQKLARLYPESVQVQQIYAEVRHELFNILKSSQGNVLVWGTGRHGELGLGEYMQHVSYPHTIYRFLGSNVTIRQISAGQSHCLAIDSQGVLYSWGQGKNGKLGHGDFENRLVPEKVKFFSNAVVTLCSAGDEHSAVITIPKKANVSGTSAAAQALMDSVPSDFGRISTFGRGAHGRLGYGSNRNCHTPKLVSITLPSVRDARVRSVSCGGAHTLALVSLEVKRGIANVYGVQTFVLAWGYGTNGQLGTGVLEDSFVPVKAKMPKCVLITEISAGRSWSLCKSIEGDCYSFGKGLRGQLGQAKDNFSFTPRKIDSFGSFIRLSAGYAHNVSIVVPKKHLTTAVAEQQALNPAFDPFRPETEFVSCSLKQMDNSSGYAFDCCRRLPVEHSTVFRRAKVPASVGTAVSTNSGVANTTNMLGKSIAPLTLIVPTAASSSAAAATSSAHSDHTVSRAKMKLRYYCATCHLHYICLPCVRICHAAHKVVEMDSRYMLNNPVIPHDTIAYTTTNNSKRSVDYESPAFKQITYHYKYTSHLPHDRTNKSTVLTYYNECHPCDTPAHYKQISTTVVNLLLADIRQQRLDSKITPKTGKHSSKGKKTPLSNVTNKLGSPKVKGKSSASPSRSRSNSPTKTKTSQKTHTVPVAPIAVPIASVKVTAGKIPACRCGLFSQCCRMIPVVTESPDESRVTKGKVEPPLLPAKTPTKHSASKMPTSKSPSKSLTKTMKADAADVKSSSVQSRINAVLETAPKRKVIIKSVLERQLFDQKRDFDFKMHLLSRQTAARVIQKRAKAFVARKREVQRMKDFALMRREVCKKHYQQNILGTIFFKVHRAYAEHREMREQCAMAFEDDLQHKFVYYQKLQSAIVGIEAVTFGVKALFGSISAMLPRVNNGIANSEEWRPTFAFSWHSVREQQMRLHPLRRINVADLALLTQHFPRHPLPGYYCEGTTFDRDLAVFTRPFLRDTHTERTNIKRQRRAEERQEMMRRAAELALERLHKMKNASKIAMAQVTKLNNRAPPAPPGKGPPRAITVANTWKDKIAAKEKHEEVIRNQERAADLPFSMFTKVVTHTTNKGNSSSDDAVVNSVVNPHYRKRRSSISDPCELYSRLQAMRVDLYTSAYCKRRNSLPIKLSNMYLQDLSSDNSLGAHQPPSIRTLMDPSACFNMLYYTPKFSGHNIRGAASTVVTDEYEIAPTISAAKVNRSVRDMAEQLGVSMSMFTLRCNAVSSLLVTINMAEFNDEPAVSQSGRHVGAVASSSKNKLGINNFRSKKSYAQRLKKQLKYTVLTKLPTEIHLMLCDSERRRTIGEPERLSRHLDHAIKMREKFSDLVAVGHDKLGVHRRRRSFDFTEERYTANGINSMLGYEFELNASPDHVLSATTLRAHAFDMEQHMITQGYIAEASEAFLATKLQRENSKTMHQHAANMLARQQSIQSSQNSKKLTKNKSKISNLRDTSAKVSGSVRFNVKQTDAPHVENDDFSNDEYGYGNFSTTTAGTSIYQEYYNEDGLVYYYNKDTGESVWETPWSEWGEVQFEQQYQDEAGHWYWYNSTTRESYYM